MKIFYCDQIGRWTATSCPSDCLGTSDEHAVVDVSPERAAEMANLLEDIFCNDDPDEPDETIGERMEKFWSWINGQ